MFLIRQKLTYCIMIILQISCAHGQVHELSQDKDHMLGVMEAHLATLDGWQSGDVLVRYEIEGQGQRYDAEGYTKGPDALSVVVKRKGLIRLIFDFERGRAVIINRKEDEKRVFDALDEEIREPIRRSDDRMAVLDTTRGIGVGRLRPGSVHTLKQLPSVETLLLELGVPNIKAFGTGYSFDTWRTKVLIDSMRYQMQPELIASISHIGKDRYQVFLLGNPRIGEEKGGFRVYTDWNVNDNVPIKYVSYSGANKEINSASKRPYSTETVEWDKLNGNPLPVLSRRSFSSAFLLESDLRFAVDYEQITDLHWFSFNEELADEFFDPKILDDRKRVDELLSEIVFNKEN